MTTRQAEEDTRGPAEVIAEDAVAAYLEAHPSFFERHPDLVVRLTVPHASGRAVSLIERQVGVLRGQLETERRRLAHLIARARDFETLSGRLHDLSLQLIAAHDLERIQTILSEALRQEFNAEAVTLKLFPLESDTDDAAEQDVSVSAFLEFVDREHALCGHLDAERNGVLFGAHSEVIHSAALIPIRADKRSGVLAIGSSDPERFGPEMGTDLLDRLGAIVSQKLRVLPEADG
jgi:uncharacterized protein YigA (DUF484 family)